MKYLEWDGTGDPLIGLAYGPLLNSVLENYPDMIDYVEISFEQLRHAPEIARVQEQIPALLHCASMSVAGFVTAGDDTLSAIAREATRMGTPWIGEHLAFISADPLVNCETSVPTTLTYTVCPQLSEQVIERVADNMERLQARFPEPIILENSPQYFDIPGSTIPMAEFVSAVAERCGIGLLLDLTHFLITSINMDVDVHKAIRRLPLERVVEVHMSGMSVQSGIAWDDHASPAPDAVFELLPAVLERGRIRALTFEYNWSPNLPHEVVVRQILRARQLLAA